MSQANREESASWGAKGAENRAKAQGTARKRQINWRLLKLQRISTLECFIQALSQSTNKNVKTKKKRASSKKNRRKNETLLKWWRL